MSVSGSADSGSSSYTIDRIPFFSSLPQPVMDAGPSRRTLTPIAVVPYIGRAIRRYCSSKEIAKIRRKAPGRIFIEGVLISEVVSLARSYESAIRFLFPKR